MGIRYVIILICVSALSFSPSSHSQEGGNFDDRESPGSYVGLEVGPTYILSDDGSGVDDPFMIYFNVGFTLNKLFNLYWENQNFTLGPRVGIGFGESSTGTGRSLFYSIVGNFRYTPGNGESTFRPYIEAGPGFGNYTGAAVHVDVGTGLDIFYNDQDSIGIAAHYIEYFTGGVVRSATLLASLTHHW